MRTLTFAITFGFALFAAATETIALSGDDKSKSMTYATDIAPLVKTHCQRCHSTTDDVEGGLSLDSLDGLMKGGEHGTSVVPGKPAESLMYQKLSAKPPFGKQMPRGKNKLSESEIQLIYEWIVQGAKK
jgi:mono/diheme cytochrome c family protein